MGLKPILRTTTSFSALTLLVGSFDPYKLKKKPVPDMTYNVFSGTLNPAQSTMMWFSKLTTLAMATLGYREELCVPQKPTSPYKK